MYALVLATLLMGQVEGPEIPPAPAPEIVDSSPNSSTASTEELKAWLLSRLIIELSFNEEKLVQVEKRLDNMSERQLRILIDLYKDRVAKRDQAEAARQQYMQQQVLNQAKLDLMRAQGYKEFLEREYQRKILQGEMETNLVRQNIQNNNRFMQPFGGVGNPYYGNFGVNRFQGGFDRNGDGFPDLYRRW